LLPVSPAEPVDPRGRRVLEVELRVPLPASPRALLALERVDRGDLVLDFGAGLVAVFLVDAPLELVERDLAVLVPAGGALAERPAPGPRSPPTSRLTMRVRSSIRLVSLSTSAWLAVLFSRFCTCVRLDWMALWPWARLRSNCLARSGGSLFWRSFTAVPAAWRAWLTRLPSAGLRVDARFLGVGIFKQLLVVSGSRRLFNAARYNTRLWPQIDI
jgi:hypothetical protein